MSRQEDLIGEYRAAVTDAVNIFSRLRALRMEIEAMSYHPASGTMVARFDSPVDVTNEQLGPSILTVFALLDGITSQAREALYSVRI